MEDCVCKLYSGTVESRADQRMYGCAHCCNNDVRTYVCNLTPAVADEMGLGKTLTMISLVLKDFPGEGKWREGSSASQGERQLQRV